MHNEMNEKKRCVKRVHGPVAWKRPVGWLDIGDDEHELMRAAAIFIYLTINTELSPTHIQRTFRTMFRPQERERVKEIIWFLLAKNQLDISDGFVGQGTTKQ